MNFYKAQDIAKRKTRYLILLFSVVLFLLIVFSSVVLIFIFAFSTSQASFSSVLSSLFSDEYRPIFYAASVFIIGGALLSSFSKNKQLSKGGSVIAASMGGIKLAFNTKSLNERKLLNVVEEMAIASGMPVPDVFILKSEKGINAFAAGNEPSDAAIGVTQGCIEKLTRQQLQGVIGHEFSHILNGDMRLNSHIILFTHGVGFIGDLGRILVHSRRVSVKGNRVGVKLAGGVLLILGWLGSVSGRIIQAGVSRQREFLADASSVQFTRDPSAIAGALKVIGGEKASSIIKNKIAKEIAHMFFGEGFKNPFSLLFNTHPPIEKRILSVEPEWDGEFLESVLNENLSYSFTTGTPVKQSTMIVLPMALQILSRAGVNVDKLTVSNQDKLNQLILKTREPFDAMILVIAVLIYKEQISTAFLKNLSLNFEKLKTEKLLEMVNQQVTLLSNVGLSNYLPLIELAMPSLKMLSLNQYLPLKSLLKSIMAKDGKETVFEKSIYQLVIHYLDKHFGLLESARVRYYFANQIAAEVQVVLSVVLYFGSEKLENKKYLFEKSLTDLGILRGSLKLIEAASAEKRFDEAMDKLAYCSKSLKLKLVETFAFCVEHDAEVNQVEMELVFALAITLETPLPRLKTLNL